MLGLPHQGVSVRSWGQEVPLTFVPECKTDWPWEDTQNEGCKDRRHQGGGCPFSSPGSWRDCSQDIHHTSRVVALVREGPQWPHGLGGDGTRQAGEQPGAEK